ncbi:permease-like cell division protein FtsX [Kangiella sediminilitoris]|uniref:Cell division protein FtsX n=1 Tax=Kangiella sediminilitoris TaxID=1144748 RepID=A0A1B3BE38_9GAMM|nr:permease-like cell division protein FtsX [Kangiella sediminilitoris]AOE50967.1 Cell division protein FtsX [Kangiella sediminilitoris]
MSNSQPTHRKSSATSYKVKLTDRIQNTMKLHRENVVQTLLDILRQPTNSLMTILVLAIALALPAAFYLFMSNAQSVSESWDGGVKMAIYLDDKATENQAQDLFTTLSQRVEFEEVVFVSKDDGLEMFKQYSGLGNSLEYLDTNPLPYAITLKPTPSFSDSDQLELLAAELAQLPLVAQTKLDSSWIKKYNSILEISEQIATFISIMLALGVLLIVGNTIRLAILNRREEIQVIKLVGATDAFIRRPFLYTGLWYGAIAALLAALMVNIMFVLLQQSTHQLAQLYSSNFSLLGLAPGFTLSLLLCGALLGLLGAWVSVRKHLKDINPQ